MARLINCSACGKFFEQNINEATCPDCFQKDLLDFERIREFLVMNPRAKLLRISSELDIPIVTIKRFLREGRLEIVEKDNLFLRCESCGKPICSGTHCEECSKQTQHDYKSVWLGNSSSKGQSKSKINYRKY